MTFGALMSEDLEDSGFRARLVSSSGRHIALDVHRWLTEPGEEEQDLLDRAIAPVIDIGCGPGAKRWRSCIEGSTSSASTPPSPLRGSLGVEERA